MLKKILEFSIASYLYSTQLEHSHVVQKFFLEFSFGKFSILLLLFFLETMFPNRTTLLDAFTSRKFKLLNF